MAMDLEGGSGKQKNKKEMDGRRISICIPTHNRVEMTIESFNRVYADDRVDEIIIVDDASDEGEYKRLKAICDCMPKVKLYRNVSNLDCYANKRMAVSYATKRNAIVLDSDNEIGTDYIDKIFQYEWVDNIVLQPSFAAPSFDFRNLEGLYVTRKNAAECIDRYPLFTTMLNAMNYFVCASEYLRVWKGDINPYTADSIYHALNWLEAGGEIFVVPGLTYHHRIHNGSHYQNNKHKTGNIYHIIEQKIRQLS